MSGQTSAGIRLAAAVLAVLLTTGMASAGSRRADGPGVIYAAFTFQKSGRAASKRCGPYTVRGGIFTGRPVSPDQRLAGRATLNLLVAVDRRTGLGFTRGTLRVRGASGRLRMSSVIHGVNSNSTTVNGIVSGNLYGPSALLLANLTMLFNENFTAGFVQLGLEAGRNSAVAYTPLSSRCAG